MNYIKKLKEKDLAFKITWHPSIYSVKRSSLSVSFTFDSKRTVTVELMVRYLFSAALLQTTLLSSFPQSQNTLSKFLCFLYIKFRYHIIYKTIVWEAKRSSRIFEHGELGGEGGRRYHGGWTHKRYINSKLCFHGNFLHFFFILFFWILYNYLIYLFIFCCCWAGTRFRPLSFNTPKPLFPLAGQPMVHHPISACKRVSFF